MKKKLHAFIRDEEALTIVEYALAAALLALGNSIGTIITSKNTILAP